MVIGHFFGDEFLQEDIHWIMHLNYLKKQEKFKTHITQKTLYAPELPHCKYLQLDEVRLSKHKSLKCIDIYGNKHTYKYIVFLCYIQML